MNILFKHFPLELGVWLGCEKLFDRFFIILSFMPDVNELED